MKKRKIFKLLIVLVILAFVVLFSVAGYNFGKRIFSDESVQEFPGTDVGVVIESGMGKDEVADLLYESGLIVNKNVFVIQCTLYEAEFYPGEYILNTSYSSEEIIEELKIKDE